MDFFERMGDDETTKPPPDGGDPGAMPPEGDFGEQLDAPGETEGTTLPNRDETTDL